MAKRAADVTARSSPGGNVQQNRTKELVDERPCSVVRSMSVRLNSDSVTASRVCAKSRPWTGRLPSPRQGRRGGAFLPTCRAYSLPARVSSKCRTARFISSNRGRQGRRIRRHCAVRNALAGWPGLRRSHPPRRGRIPVLCPRATADSERFDVGFGVAEDEMDAAVIGSTRPSPPPSSSSTERGNSTGPT